MGTKIQTNACWPNNHSVVDLNVNASSSPRFFYCENQTLKTADSLTPLLRKHGYMGVEKEKVRQTILKHEWIFRNQLEELHRLYRRQRELMNELTCKTIKRDELMEENSTISFLSPVPVKATNLKWDALQSTAYFSGLNEQNNSMMGSNYFANGASNQSRHEGQVDLTLSRGYVSAKSCSNFHILSKDPDYMSDDYVGTGAVFGRKRKLFGVEIPEESNDPLVTAPYTPITSSDDQRNPKNLKGDVPWFLRNQEYHSEPSKGGRSSYFMNLDTLQSRSCGFFQKAEIEDRSFPALKKKKEMSATMATDDVEAGSIKGSNCTDAKKILGFPNSDTLKISEGQEIWNSVTNDSGVNDKPVSRNQIEAKELPLQNCMLNLRHQIDLNVSWDEEDAPPSTPSLPTAIVKIASTEIDLEAPAAIESEEDESPHEAKTRIMEASLKESDRTAAETMIAISLSGKKNDFSSDASELKSFDHLKWFADVISSQCCDKIRVHLGEHYQMGVCDEEESIPDGMDDFEFMTLNLQETKEEYPIYEPVSLNTENDEDPGNTTSARRSHRGQSRRGRQWIDFQRDVLPSLATLSRHEVTEDLQAFEQVFEGEGGIWPSSKRKLKKNARGRKRSQDPSTTLSPSSTPTNEESVFRVPRLEERCLSGWGRRTKRLPRQRCSNFSVLSIPVKC